MQLTDPEQKKALEKASESAEKTLSSVWSVLGKARKMEAKDPDAARKEYQKAIELEPSNTTVLGSYARFLRNVCRDMEGADAYYRRAIEADPMSGPALNNYAHFLQHVRKDMEGAEGHYRRAIEADPEPAIPLVNYAGLLQHVRKDMEGAEVHYRRAIEADPNGGLARVSYSALLGAAGKLESVGEQLEKASALELEPRISARLHFIRYAHLDDALEGALKALARLLPNAEPSPYFDLTPNIERAKLDGHPNVPLLEDLAKVLKGDASMDVLDRHPAWREAQGERPARPPSRKPKSVTRRRKK